MSNALFTEVAADEVIVPKRRGYAKALLTAFIEANIAAAKVDRTKYAGNENNLRPLLESHIKSHKLPVQLRQIKGELFMFREGMADAKTAE